MNRLFTVLILTILFSQSAWSFHSTEFNHFQEQAYSQTSDQHDGASEISDHCGHASAHLVGLISNNTIVLHAGTRVNLIILTNIPSSISYQPPVPPPTS